MSFSSSRGRFYAVLVSESLKAVWMVGFVSVVGGVGSISGGSAENQR
jgi:hypothetical protein